MRTFCRKLERSCSKRGDRRNEEEGGMGFKGELIECLRVERSVE